MSRKFRYIHGFLDNTDYVEILGNGNCRLINNNGDTIKGDYSDITLEYCLDKVSSRIWVELPDDFPDILKKAKLIKRLGDKILNA